MLNIANPDDHIVIIVSGAFGNRFKQIAQTYYNHVHVYDVNWGEAVIVDDFITYLKQLNVQSLQYSLNFVKHLLVSYIQFTN